MKSNYPFVRFKSHGETIKETTEVFAASYPTIVDGVMVGNHEKEPTSVKLYVRKAVQQPAEYQYKTTCIVPGPKIAGRGTKELLEGSVLYLEVGDIISVGLSYGDQGGVLISYRELLNQPPEVKRGQALKKLDTGLDEDNTDLNTDL